MAGAVGVAWSGAALADWLAIRDAVPGPLFCPVDKAGRVALRRMTPQAVLYLLRRRAARAKVAHCSPHDLRRTFIGDLLDAGANIATVQQLAGHSGGTGKRKRSSPGRSRCGYVWRQAVMCPSPTPAPCNEVGRQIVEKVEWRSGEGAPTAFQIEEVQRRTLRKLEGDR